MFVLEESVDWTDSLVLHGRYSESQHLRRPVSLLPALWLEQQILVGTV